MNDNLSEITEAYRMNGIKAGPRPVRSQAPNSELDHFLDLVTQGKRRGCSSGEMVALELATKIAASMYLLDDAAVAGMIEFIGIAKQSPSQARDFVRV